MTKNIKWDIIGAHSMGQEYLRIGQYCTALLTPEPDTQLLRSLVPRRPPLLSSWFHPRKSHCICPMASNRQPCSQLKDKDDENQKA